MCTTAGVCEVLVLISLHFMNLKTRDLSFFLKEKQKNYSTLLYNFATRADNPVPSLFKTKPAMSDEAKHQKTALRAGKFFKIKTKIFAFGLSPSRQATVALKR